MVYCAMKPTGGMVDEVVESTSHETSQFLLSL
jgi:hypothetical protein